MMSERNPRNQVYPGFEDHPAPGAGLLTRLWRVRTELLVVATLIGFALSVLAATQQGRWIPFVALTSAISVPAATRLGRNWFVAHFWCVLSRHRIQRICIETPMHTRAGRIPLVLWITPTATGEKALILTRAGVCAEDFEAFAGELEAACLARAVKVHRHRRWAHLVIVEIVRRDAHRGAVPPGLERLYGRDGWVPIRSTRGEAEEPPDRRATLLIPLG